MPYGLQRFQKSKQSHFVTFSCYHRQACLGGEAQWYLFVHCLESMRRRHGFRVYGYVTMPEHVHLLISEPDRGLLATAIQALKLSVVRQGRPRGAMQAGAFWQKRYCDHNVRTHQSFVEKLRYIHRNPVKRGLCASPLGWKWSSFRHYATAEAGPIEIESPWTADHRQGRNPHPLTPRAS